MDPGPFRVYGAVVACGALNVRMKSPSCEVVHCDQSYGVVRALEWSIGLNSPAC